MPKKIILDVNIFIALIVFGSSISQKIVSKWLDNRLWLAYSNSLEEELTNKLRHFKRSEEQIENWLAVLRENGYFVETTVTLQAVRDKKDNYLVELAQSIKADFLITRDKDLLSLGSFGSYDSTQIVTPESFVKNYLD